MEAGWWLRGGILPYGGFISSTVKKVKGEKRKHSPEKLGETAPVFLELVCKVQRSFSVTTLINEKVKSRPALTDPVFTPGLERRTDGHLSIWGQPISSAYLQREHIKNVYSPHKLWWKMNPTTILNHYSKRLALTVTICSIHVHRAGTAQACQGGLSLKERIESRCTRWKAPSTKPRTHANSNTTKWATGVGPKEQAPCSLPQAISTKGQNRHLSPQPTALTRVLRLFFMLIYSAAPEVNLTIARYRNLKHPSSQTSSIFTPNSLQKRNSLSGLS